MKIFCISIFNQNFKQFKKLCLVPVGLGITNFSTKWLTDKKGQNISQKNLYFGEYTFHYYLWKNRKKILKSKKWIGFCSYRRFWTNQEELKIQSFNNLNKIIVKKPLKHWKNFDVILVKPLQFKKIKNIKLIKENIIEVFRKPSMLFKNNSLEDQFRVFHGSFYLDTAIDLLPKKYRKEFKTFMSGHLLYPYNMFICKNYKILFKFYDEVFPWLFECEKKFKNTNLVGYNKTRIYGFLAERFMPFWFKKNFSTTTCPITFFEKK